jgi:hypothetical protein
MLRDKHHSCHTLAGNELTCRVQGDALGDPTIEFDPADFPDDDDDAASAGASSEDDDAGPASDGEPDATAHAGARSALKAKRWAVSDAELDGVDVFALPSPSSSSSSAGSDDAIATDDSDAEAEQDSASDVDEAVPARKASTKATQRQRGNAAGARSAGKGAAARKRASEAAADEEEESDLDEDALMRAMFGGGGGDSDSGSSSGDGDASDIELAAGGDLVADEIGSDSSGDSESDSDEGSSEDDGAAPSARPVGGKAQGGGKIAKPSKKRKGASVFAAAEDYEDTIAELERQRAGAAPLWTTRSSDPGSGSTMGYLSCSWARCAKCGC